MIALEETSVTPAESPVRMDEGAIALRSMRKLSKLQFQMLRSSKEKGPRRGPFFLFFGG